LGVVLWKVGLIVGISVVLWSGIIAGLRWSIATVISMMR